MKLQNMLEIILSHSTKHFKLNHFISCAKCQVHQNFFEDETELHFPFFQDFWDCHLLPNKGVMKNIGVTEFFHEK